jgi:hypothetical protein
MEPPARSIARLALFLSSFTAAVLLGNLGEAGRRGLRALALLAVLGCCWMIYLSCLWLLGRTFRGARRAGVDGNTLKEDDLLSKASLLLGPEEAQRLAATLTPGQLHALLEKNQLKDEVRQ